MKPLKTDRKTAIEDLLAVMEQLRNPDGGCPWDLEQDFATIAPYTIEEAYEVADAIDRADIPALKEELGDLLFQVVYHAQMAAEAGDFAFADVVDAVTAKMVSRHPHVFSDAQAANAADVEKRIWEDQKAKEKSGKGHDSVLDDVPLALPALRRAQKLQNRAACVGFEWPDVSQVLDKMDEEVAEMREALKGGKKEEILDELGDLFFVLTNFGRMLGADCEETLRQASRKFERRFRGVEAALKAQGVKPGDATLERMEGLWTAEKKKERT
ncbi:MAG: nucleoside triphosphate pyrophosphohydrolase [Proteobacteria bacterium]|nr:nucleoside triphosphate pyrophosphohydrolase [Pseudomonadota bacterium]